MRWVLTGLDRAANLLPAALLSSLVGIGATPAAAATCASLAGLRLPDTTITLVEPVPAGPYTAPDGRFFANLPAFCRIAATLTPTSGLDALLRLELQVSGDRQWQLRRAYCLWQLGVP